MNTKHRGMMRLGCASALSLVLAGAATDAGASKLSIAPVRIELAAEQRTQALRIRNEHPDRTVLIQAQVFAWSQRDGEDVLTPTREVLATPPVFTLAPGDQQLVRVAVRSPATAPEQSCYRLILQEVPARGGAVDPGLNVALRFSLPVFVEPGVPSAPALQWQATRAPGALVVQVTNTGNAHVQIAGFELHPRADRPALGTTVARYVLPGSTMRWSLPVPAGPSADEGWRLVGTSDRGPIEADVRIATP
jgi:fimbrial chaperone protein